jgi:GlpG protein
LNWIAVRHFPLDQNLSALSNYLHERGLQHRITEESGQQCLAVLDEAVIPALQDFLNQYAQGDVVLQPAVAAPSAIPTGPGVFEQAMAAPVVICLIILSGLGALAVGKPIASHFYFAGFGEAHSGGEIWRLLTPAFLHFGIFHVLFNSLWMWDLGRRLEYFMGHWHFLIFFAVTAVASNIAQYWWEGSTNFGGMSGVVYALVGFIAIRQRLAPHPLVAVPSALIGFMLFWLVLCMTGVVDYFISGSVANAAHVGGLVAGALYALLTKNLYQRY